MSTLDPTRGVRQATIQATLTAGSVSLFTHLAGTMAGQIPVYSSVTMENLGDGIIQIANMPQGFSGTPAAADFTDLGAGESETYDILTLRTCFIKVADIGATNKLKFRGSPEAQYV